MQFVLINFPLTNFHQATGLQLHPCTSTGVLAWDLLFSAHTQPLRFRSLSYAANTGPDTFHIQTSSAGHFYTLHPCHMSNS